MYTILTYCRYINCNTEHAQKPKSIYFVAEIHFCILFKLLILKAVVT